MKIDAIKTTLYYGNNELFRIFFTTVRFEHNSVQMSTKIYRFFLFSDNPLIESQIMLRGVTEFLSVPYMFGAWGSVVVKALRY
jgi:hypothetical protein